MKPTNKSMLGHGGFSLLEVVLAIAVFAFGMLALVELQTGLARSSSDANTRTVAVNIAEELVESARGFTQITADPDNGRVDYNELITYGDVATVRRGDPDDPERGLDYLVNLRVEDHYWDTDSETFTTEQPVGIVNSDYKTMDIVVMWRGLEAGETFDDHDTIDFSAGGGVRIIESVPSTPSLLGALVASDREASGAPEVNFNPGDNPDIVALQLDDSGEKFKESTSPQPDVLRGDYTQTWFDVVTYSKIDGNSVFLRREEFVAVSCECELRSDPEAGGLRPTLWNGFDYTEGEFVVKNSGERASGSPDSLYCDICCRDHHDGGSSATEDVYNPLVASGDGDHPHYGVDGAGNINAAAATTSSPDYVEACRLVRKDGFMRVAQDAVQQGLFGFPEEYLTFDVNVQEYSNYVVEAVGSYYEADQSGFTQPENMEPPYVIPASTTDTATDLPTVYFATSQQLRSRGVYTDYLTQEAEHNLAHCFDDAGEPTPDDPDCQVPYATSPLELYPFFDLQLTWLTRWNEEPVGTPVEVTNEPVETNNTHSRGRADLVDSGGGGQVRSIITSHKGNLGLTATGPIDGTYNSQTDTQNLYIDVNEDNTPASNVGVVVSGSLSSGVSRVSSADLVLTASQALCGQTDVEYSCLVSSAVATLTVSGYYKRNTPLWACSDLETAGFTVNPALNNRDEPVGGTSDTTFVLPNTETIANIWIQGTECP